MEALTSVMWLIYTHQDWCIYITMTKTAVGRVGCYGHVDCWEYSICKMPCFRQLWYGFKLYRVFIIVLSILESTSPTNAACKALVETIISCPLQKKMTWLFRTLASRTSRERREGFHSRTEKKSKSRCKMKKKKRGMFMISLLHMKNHWVDNSIIPFLDWH